MSSRCSRTSGTETSTFTLLRFFTFSERMKTSSTWARHSLVLCNYVTFWKLFITTLAHSMMILALLIWTLDLVRVNSETHQGIHCYRVNSYRLWYFSASNHTQISLKSENFWQFLCSLSQEFSFFLFALEDSILVGTLWTKFFLESSLGCHFHTLAISSSSQEFTTHFLGRNIFCTVRLLKRPDGVQWR